MPSIRYRSFFSTPPNVPLDSAAKMIRCSISIGWVAISIGAFGCQSVPDNPLDPISFDSGGETSGSEIENDSGGPSPDPITDCRPGINDACGDEEKCTVTRDSSSGGLVYRCVEIPDNMGYRPPYPYEACQASIDDGKDLCSKGHACFPLSPDDPDNGICLPLCLDDQDCDKELCRPDPVSEIPTCISRCNPFESTCIESSDCVYESNDFVCQMRSPRFAAKNGEPCSEEIGLLCGASLVCVDGVLLPDCDFNRCCSPICNLQSDSSDCPDSTRCEPISEQAIPGLEQVGVCFLPLD